MTESGFSSHFPDITYIMWLAESGKSWIHKTSPWTKLTFMFVTILLIVNIENLQYLIIIYLIIIILYITARLPLKVLLNWYFIPLIFVIMIALPLSLNQPGFVNYFYINAYFFELFFSDRGLSSFLLLLIRGLSSVTISFIFIMTTRYKEIVYIVHKILPSPLSDILLLTYRYIFLAMVEIGSRLNALRLRGGSVLKFSSNFRNLGNLIALSIINGITRSIRLSKAIEIRGGGSEKIYVNEPVKRPKIFGIITIVCMISLFIGSLIFGFNYIIQKLVFFNPDLLIELNRNINTISTFISNSLIFWMDFWRKILVFNKFY